MSIYFGDTTNEELISELQQRGIVMIPRELTAENGAKSALIGEFSIDFPMKCCCAGEQDDCEVCGGAGEYMQPVNVPWTTIKEIVHPGMYRALRAIAFGTRFDSRIGCRKLMSRAELQAIAKSAIGMAKTPNAC